MISIVDPQFSIVDQVDGHLLMRGARPTSFEACRDLKVDSILNLEAGWFEFLHMRNFEEDMWAEELKIEMFHLPMSDFFAPDPSLLRTAVALLVKQLRKGNVYVHCLHGMDRTGMVIAAYDIIVKRRKPDVAIANMYEKGFHKIPYFYWAPQLQKLSMENVDQK
jgi:protein-tyrosine phosphatase